MRTTNAERVLEFESAALARFAELFDVFDDDVACLRDLIRQGGITQIGRGHTVVHPARRRFLPFGNIGIDVFSHAGGESDHIVIGDLLDLVDALDREIGMIANPQCFFFGDAGFSQLSLRFARKHLDLFPNGELVFKLPDLSHVGAGVTTNHRMSFRAHCRERAALTDRVNST